MFEINRRFAARRVAASVLSVAGIMSFLAGCGASLDGLGSSTPTTPTQPTTPATGRRYSGPYATTVQRLMNAGLAAWKLSANPSEAQAPTIPNSLPCIRDTYIYAALLNAWAADEYTYSGQPEKASAYVNSMVANLKNADQLCSDSPVVGGGTPCRTARITCPISIQR